MSAHADRLPSAGYGMEGKEEEGKRQQGGVLRSGVGRGQWVWQPGDLPAAKPRQHGVRAGATVIRL